MGAPYRDDEAFARELDAADPLARFREQFHVPAGPERQRDRVLVERDRADRRRVELALEVRGPGGGIARVRRAGPAGDGQRALELADPSVAQPARQLP